MRLGPWIQRYGVAFGVAFLVITGGQWLKGHSLQAAAHHGLTWALLSAACYVGGQLYWARQGKACALCEGLASVKRQA